jgi:undecaprenyl-diphosphatase
MQLERRRIATDAAVVIVGVAIVVATSALVATGLSDHVDRPIIAALRSAALGRVLAGLRGITELGSTPAVAVVAVVVLTVGLVAGSWRAGLAGAITITLASLGNTVLKLTIARARPELLDPIVVEHGFSFPSGHALLSMVAYGVLAVVVGRSSLPTPLRVAIAAVLGALVGLVGISRVWLGVHYPTDVVAGWVAGVVVVTIYAALTRAASPAPAAEVAVADPAGPRSDPPAAA